MLNFVFYCALDTLDISSHILLYQFILIFFKLNIWKKFRILNLGVFIFYRKLEYFEYFFAYHDLFTWIIDFYKAMWFDGLMLDSLQKMTLNKWTHQFIIGTVMLFNDRFLFEKPSRFMLDNLAKPLQNRFFFEGSDLFLTISSILFFISFVFIVLQAIFFVCTLLLCGVVPSGSLGIFNILSYICNT